ncbi:MAG: phosphatidylserine decarboxylase family protein [Anaerolineaceae bacterium]|nr:phosphatidylserine decarboxylase family protein [Anaerolineaceae bacterium]
MRIHREGYSTLRKLAVGLAAVCGLSYLVLPRRALAYVVGASALIFGFFTQFFRNPVRITPNIAEAIIAPADGTIVAIEPTIETEYFHDERLKISIYMSALNVHVNRVPVTGKVVYDRYHPGEYLVAFHPKASELNERNTVVLENSHGQEVLVRQIAGLLARRIRYFLQPEQQVQAGSELGFIKFGSRCDVFLPLDAQVKVYLDQRVTGGETILAELADKQ